MPRTGRSPACWECHRQRNQDSYRRTVPRNLWRNAQRRAQERGIEFSILPEHVEVPSHCPALGIPLVVTHGQRGSGDHSPTLDRIDPQRGYVPGNVAVISGRANRCKNDLSCEELAAVLSYARRMTVEP